MWDSISCTIRAFLSTSSALFMPLLILSATCLMLRWASMRKGWSGWSSGVCFSRSCRGTEPGCHLWQSLDIGSAIARAPPMLLWLLGMETSPREGVAMGRVPKWHRNVQQKGRG